jgi:hypothetical protein
MRSEGHSPSLPDAVGASGPSSRKRGEEGNRPPGCALKGLPSVSSVPDGSVVGHFHSVLRPRAVRHLFSISLEAEANPGLDVARISQRSHTRQAAS